MLIKISDYKPKPGEVDLVQIMDNCPSICEIDGNYLKHFNFEFVGNTLFAQAKCPRCGFTTESHSVLNEDEISRILPPGWQNIK